MHADKHDGAKLCARVDAVAFSLTRLANTMRISRLFIALSLISVLSATAHGAFFGSAGGWVQTAKLMASTQLAYQWLGHSAAVSADGNTIAVGAPGDPTQNSQNGYAGAVYVYTRAANVAWSSHVEVARLTASDGAPNDQLGFAIAVSADGSVIVAGAPARVSGNTTGAVYVFVRSGATWVHATQVARLDTATVAGDVVAGLGRSVAISQNGTRIVAGAPNTAIGPSPTTSNAGAAFVFDKPVGNWTTASTPAARLTLENVTADDLLGTSVAMDADGDTVVVGASARTDDNVNGYRGVGFVYTLPSILASVITPTAALRASDISDSDLMGAAAAIDDAGNTIVLGAPGGEIEDGEFGSPRTTGAGFVFSKPASGWSGVLFDTARLTASDGIADDLMGTAVTLSADGRHVALGAPGYDDGISIPNDGAAYFFMRPPGGWRSTTENNVIPATNMVGGERVGRGLGLSATADALVLGAPYENFGPNPNVNPNPRAAGAVYVTQFGTQIEGPTELVEYINTPLVYTYTVSGIPSPSVPSMTGALPAGVTFDSATGVLSGSPSQGGNFTITLQTSNFIGFTSTARLTTTLRVISEVVIAGGPPPDGVVGRPYAHTFTTNVNNATWGIAVGNPPPGMNFANGVFAGTPTTAGLSTSTVQIQSGPLTNTRAIAIRVYDVLTITTAALAQATVREPYSAALNINLGLPTTWSVVAGAVPPGLGLNPLNGVLSGISTQSGTYGFTVEVGAGTQTATRNYTVVVSPRLTFLPVSVRQ
jgi:hypothetical protein